MKRLMLLTAFALASQTLFAAGADLGCTKGRVNLNLTFFVGEQSIFAGRDVERVVESKSPGLFMNHPQTTFLLILNEHGRKALATATKNGQGKDIQILQNKKEIVSLPIRSEISDGKFQIKTGILTEKALTLQTFCEP